MDAAARVIPEPHLWEFAVQKNSPRTRLRGGLALSLATAFFAVATIGSARFSPLPTPIAITFARPVTAPAVSAPFAEPTLLADEITRRLRRMGINFSRTRLPHPYDPVGEVC